MERVRRATRNLDACPRICVANRQQVSAWNRRLASDGGCIGAHVVTFDDLFMSCLGAAGLSYSLLGEIQEYRLLRSLITNLSPRYYSAVANFPGFIQECQRLIRELKSALIRPSTFAGALSHVGNPPRLIEIGQIYAAYQEYLDANSLADYPGLAWLALEVAADTDFQLGHDWPLLILDGFASFTQTQLAFIKELKSRVPEIIITLSGDPHGESPRPCHRHYHRTRRTIEQTLQIQATALEQVTIPPGVFAHLERHLFSDVPPPDLDDSGDNPATHLQLITVSDQQSEVVTALRWLKRRIVEGGIAYHDAALVARDIQEYRPFILLKARELDLPVYFVEGLPLQKNPAIAALFSLLQMLLPAGAQSGNLSPLIPYRSFISALRSPYFRWHEFSHQDPSNPDSGMTPHEVDQLDSVARWGQVIAGVAQWRDALDRLAQMKSDRSQDDYGEEPANGTGILPLGEQAHRLRQKLELILARLQPPPGKAPVTAFIAWLENLISPEPETGPRHESVSAPEPSLNLLQAVREGPAGARSRDIAALRRFKDVLRGLYWSHANDLAREDLDYTGFVEELIGAADAVTYYDTTYRQQDAILVSNVVQARGVPCRALAVLGLAEGLFPAPLTEEPFLRELDRTILREEHDLYLDSAIDSHEQEYFYETITRTREWLLLTRPALTDTGASWEPSPYWHEVQRISGIQPLESDPLVTTPASHVELLFQLAQTGSELPLSLQREDLAVQWQRIQQGAAIFMARSLRKPSPFDGSLLHSRDHLQDRFGDDHIWSPSRLESYLNCPLSFFLSNVLAVQSRPEPAEGLDARQLGNLYHRLLDATYRRLPRAQRNDPQSVLDSLHQVAPAILANAPQDEGFRESAWWQETQQEIMTNLENTLQALTGLDDGFVPSFFEQFFGRDDCLVIQHGDRQVRIRGVVDRVDVNEAGEIRLIDYKTAGPYAYTTSAHRDGRLIQLPIYALAAEKALKLGKVVDGFYWHIQHAEASSFKLANVGLEQATDNATTFALNVVEGVREGQFTPTPPRGGCPSYCPGAAFCWHYVPRRSS